MKAVCSACDVDREMLGTPSREKPVVRARAVFTVLATHRTTLSYPQIARAIGKHNHSTVVTAHKRERDRDRLGLDTRTRELCDEVCDMFGIPKIVGEL